jgi:peptide/nickel transport system permease protein
LKNPNSTFRKTIKHPLGLIGLFIVSLFFIMGILGNLITPDKTTNSNLINLPIALLKPMSKVQFFNVENPIQKSFFSAWLSGQNEPVMQIAINSYSIKGDTAYLNLFYPEKTINEKVQLSTLPAPYTIKNQTFLLGTDGFGRDVYSRIVLGSRVSLAVGIVAVIVSLFLIGTALGLIAGYYRGKTDTVISWFINVIWSLPTMLLVAAISFALGKGFWQIFVAIGISAWVEVARVVRGQVFSLREKEYIQAAKILGYSPFRIMFKHLLPNLKSTLIVLAISVFGSAILLESGLSFLGFGIAPPAPSWGMMVKENYPYIMWDNAYLAIVPGFVIMLLVMGFNFLGIALRDALDIHLK